MKKILFALILGSICTSPVFSQFSAWSHGIGSPDPDFYIDTGREIETDPDGNRIFVGDGAGTLFDFDFGPGVVGITGNAYITYLAKYSPQNQLIWVIGFNANQVSIPDIEINDSGEIYFYGSFDGPLSFLPSNTTILTASWSMNSFIGKISPQGSLLWIKQIPGSTSHPWEKTGALALDKDDNILVVTGLVGTADFDPDINSSYILTPPNNSNSIAVAKYDKNGNFKWAGPLDIDSWADNSEIGTGPNGEVIVFSISYSFSIDVDLDTGVVQSLNTSGLFLAKYDSSGSLIWASDVPVGNVNRETGALQVDPGGNIYIGGGEISSPFVARYSPSGQQQWKRLVGGDNFRDLEVDSSGNSIFVTNLVNTRVHWGKIGINGNLLWDKFHDSGNGGLLVVYDLDLGEYGAIYFTGEFSGLGCNVFGTILDPILDNQGSVTLDAFITQWMPNGNQIQGSVYVDLNNNGSRDPNEPVEKNAIVRVLPNPKTQLIGPDGNYSFNVTQGNYTLDIQNLSPLFTSINPQDHQATFPNIVGGIDSLNDFGLIPDPNLFDLAIHGANSAIRPGGPVRYDLNYSNRGLPPQNGTISLTLDPSLFFVNSSPFPDSIFGNQLFWNFSNLGPWESRSFPVQISAIPTLNIGSRVVITSAISLFQNDILPLNNIYHHSIIVVGPHDPNYKESSPPEFLSFAQIINEEPLDYTVQFQNIGTDTAFKVRILDTLDARLDLNSLELLSASHPYIFQNLSGGILEWTFYNILLPDSTTNEPLSHGYIKYRVKPLPGVLQIGNIIKNRAGIYFDYNLPVITNTAQNVVQGTYLQVTTPFPCLSRNNGIIQAQFWGANFPVLYSIDGVNFQTSPIFQFLGPGTYRIIASHHSNQRDTSEFITLYPNPTVNLGGDALLCQDSTLALNAGSGFSAYSWSDGSTQQTIWVSTTGPYSVLVTDTNGCSDSDSINITRPNVSIFSFEGTLFASQADAYQWLECPDFTPISGETQASFSPNVSGNYALSFTINGCQDTTNCESVILNDVNSPDRTDSWNIFPNPNRGIIYLTNVKPAHEVEVALFNILGEMVWSGKFFSASQFMLNIDGPAGVYLLRLKSEGKNSQFIVQKI